MILKLERLARQTFFTRLEELFGPPNGMDGSPFPLQAESLELEEENHNGD